MITEAVAAEGFKVGLTELFQYLKNKSSKYQNRPKIDVDNSYLKASKVEQVKTIWQVDRTVNLGEFYYPCKLQIDSNRVVIESLKGFPENGKIVVQGTAGQGKSIFLRYLTGNELKYGTRIPVFVELRKITNRNPIENVIINGLSNLGVDCDSSTLNYVFESNNCVLILDAFDEIKPDQVRDSLTYIEGLCEKYHQLQIIISSRPGSDIQRVTFFRVLDLCPLVPSDFPPMLDKFFQDDKSTKIDDIVKAIHNNGSGIADLITTPLLLTLLTITYKSYHRIPEKLHEFYDNLFYLLVNRHGSTKPGFSREFQSRLNEVQLEELFCAFCFYCMIEKKDTLNHSEAVGLVKKSKSIKCLNDVNEVGFLEDTKKNTCLIIEEGLEYHFIHKSIKEYHAAKFISSSPIQLKTKFYALACKEPHAFEQELEFLKNIDSYCYEKMFLIEIYKKLFETQAELGESISYDEFFEGVSVQTKNGEIKSIMSMTGCFSGNDYFNISHVALNALRECNASGQENDGNILIIYDDSFKAIFRQKFSEFSKQQDQEYLSIRKRIEQQEEAISELVF